MVIIVILMSAVLVATSAVFNKAKITQTQAVLTVVQQAVEQFEREQKDNPTLAKASQKATGGTGTKRVRFADRYGSFPPDELELFTSEGLPGADGPTLGIGGATIDSPLPADQWPAIQFYAYTAENWQYNLFESRDLAAMIVAIELYSDVASAMLDRIPNNNRHAGVLDQNGAPLIFLDRPNAEGKLDGKYDSGDLQIRYIIDSWGMAVGYLAQRDWNSTAPPDPSSNHEFWNQASTEMIRLNDGQPIIMSYGPNGGEQFEKTWMVNDEAKASLVGDWMDTEDSMSRINHQLNADNIYANPTLKEKLAEGIVR